MTFVVLPTFSYYNPNSVDLKWENGSVVDGVGQLNPVMDILFSIKNVYSAIRFSRSSDDNISEAFIISSSCDSRM